MSWSRFVAGPEDFRLSGPAPQPIQVPGVPGLVLADVWRTTEQPVSNGVRADEALVGSFKVAPDQNGTVFRVITFPPASVMHLADPQVLAKLGAQTDAKADGLMWHRTDSIDYITIVSGSIDLVTEHNRLTLNAGDVGVVRGILHAWDNVAEEECVMSCVSIGATAS